jgi:hypothetical protein
MPGRGVANDIVVLGGKWIQPNRSTGRLQAHLRKADNRRVTVSKRHAEQRTVDNGSDSVAKWFEDQDLERQESLLAKALDYCSEKFPRIVAGYRRTERDGGDAFREYQTIMLTEFLKDRRRCRDAA